MPLYTLQGPLKTSRGPLEEPGLLNHAPPY